MDHTAEEITKFIFQLAAILAAAKFSGEIFERFLRTPAVLGELTAGIAIGPFALGGIDLPWIGPLFSTFIEGIENNDVIPVSESLWSIAQVGSIVLLFVTGMETNLSQFFRYARPASVVAIGGVVLPFSFGVILTVIFGYADGFSDPKALFIGAILTATSIGITARVLGDLGQLSSAEGVTVLGAAVLDDVLGILTLTIVVGLSGAEHFSFGGIGFVAFKTIAFWLVLTGGGILLSKHISKFLATFRVNGTALALMLALAFLAAGLAEIFGLAMIIGAFSIGLALSGTEMAHKLQKPLQAVYEVFVPIFFVVMGMLVNLASLRGIWVFGLVMTIFASVGKIVGSGLPAFLTGFNRVGAWRIGIGMLPRGEIVLIMAGIGISNGILSDELYGAAIMMTAITTAIAPPILARSFRGGLSGLKTERFSLER